MSTDHSSENLRNDHRALVAALSALGGLFGHHGGDYLVQDDCMAHWKQNRDDRARARREIALHASTYAATQAVTRATFYRTAGVRVPLAAQLAGALVEAVLHAVIDDGRLLRAFSRIGAGHRRFVDDQGRNLGRQQRFHDDVPGGRALMDQAVHHQLQIPAGVVTTVAVAGLLARGRRR